MQTNVDLAQLVAGAGDGIIVSDAGGSVVLWNSAAERIFGFTEEDALGQSLDLITPHRHRERHWAGYHKTMETAVTKYGTDVLRVPALHKDGRALSIAFTISMLFGADGKVSGVAAFVRDETERFLEMREMRKRLTEAEAKAAGLPASAG